MKFKGQKEWRELDHTDKHGDNMCVSVSSVKGQRRVYISAQACSLSHKQARKFAIKLLKELDR